MCISAFSSSLNIKTNQEGAEFDNNIAATTMSNMKEDPEITCLRDEMPWMSRRARDDARSVRNQDIHVCNAVTASFIHV